MAGQLDTSTGLLTQSPSTATIDLRPGASFGSVTRGGSGGSILPGGGPQNNLPQGSTPVSTYTSKASTDPSQLPTQPSGGPLPGVTYGSGGVQSDRWGNVIPDKQIQPNGQISGGSNVGGTSSPTNTITSGPANDDLTALKASIDNANTQLQNENQTAYQNSLAQADSAFNQQLPQLQQTQASERATNATAAFRLGQSGTNYASDAAQKLDQQQTIQLNNLQAQRADAINKANAALASGNVALAKQQMDSAQKLFDDQQTLQTNQRTAQAQQLTEAINGNKLESDTSKSAQDQLATIAKSNAAPDSFTPEDKAKFEQQIGLPQGGFDSYYKAILSTTNMTTAKDAVTAAKDITSLLNSIPSGQTININGIDYTGIGADKNQQIVKETYKGQTTIAVVDKNTGKIISTSKLPATGGSASGAKPSSGFNVKSATPEMDQVLSNKTGDQGYVSKEDWANLMSQWEKAGGVRKDFVAKFKNYANPGAGYDYAGIKPIPGKPAKAASS